MSEHILKRHNKTLLLYHLVCPAKYRRKIFTEEVEHTLKEICMDIGERHEMCFVEIGADEDHVHFLIQSVPVLSPQRIVQIVKSITTKEVFRLHPEVKKQLWGGKLSTSGYYANTVGQYGNEKVIKECGSRAASTVKFIETSSHPLIFKGFDTSQPCCGVVQCGP